MTPSKPLSQMTPAERKAFDKALADWNAKNKAMSQPTKGTGTPMVETVMPRGKPAMETPAPQMVGTLATDMGSPYPDGTVIRGNNPSATKQTRPTKAGRTAMMKSGGKVGSASKRADGCAIKGKTRGRMV